MTSSPDSTNDLSLATASADETPAPPDGLRVNRTMMLPTIASDVLRISLETIDNMSNTFVYDGLILDHEICVLWDMTRHDTTRHDTTRHDTTRHDTTRHDTTRHDTTRHDTTRHDTTRHDTRRHDTTRHDTTRHGTARHGTARHGTARHGTARHTAHGTRHTAHGTRHTAHGTRHTAHGTRHTVHGTRHDMTRHDTWYCDLLQNWYTSREAINNLKR